jgi:hypothetical protein
MKARKSFHIVALVLGSCLMSAAVAFSAGASTPLPKPLPAKYQANINKAVQLQENEWVKISDAWVDEQTPAEALHLKSDDKGFEGMPNFRYLHVQIQFLKPCRASTTGPAPDLTGSPEAQAVFMIGLINYAMNHNEPKERIDAAFREYEKHCSKHGIDSGKLMMDVGVPRFRCDYRTKLFAVFFDANGIELNTDSKIPIALLINDNDRQTEILPGEKTYVKFSVPDKAVYWFVWVPK